MLVLKALWDSLIEQFAKYCKTKKLVIIGDMNAYKEDTIQKKNL